MATQEHVAAFESHLAATNLAVGVGLTTYPHIAVWPYAQIADNDLAASRHMLNVVIQTTTVAVSRSQSLAARDRVLDLLRRHRPVVAGWSCGLVEHYVSQPVRKDDSLPDREVWIAVDQWRYVATRTA